MLEAGLVRTKNVSMQSLKNIALYAVAGIMYYLIGYNLMYTGVDGGYIGSFSFMYELDPVGGNALDTGYSTGSDWFFQMVFVATAASIVSGTLAERIKPVAVHDLHCDSDRFSSTRSPVPGSGVLAGCPKWASPISPVPHSFTP